MPKTLTRLAAELGMSTAAFQHFLKQRGDLRCVDEEATFTDAEARRLRDALCVENTDEPNAGLTGMSVSRFKAFGTPQHVRLAPITLVFGQNSVGKSSFLHALLWAHHVAMTGELDVVNPTLTGNSVHLGGFDNVVFRHQHGGSFTLGFDVQTPRLNTFFDESVRFRASVSFLKPKATDDDLTPAPHPEHYWLDVDEQPLLKAHYAGKEGFAVQSLNLEHPLFARLFKRMASLSTKKAPPSGADAAKLRTYAQALATRMRFQGGRLLPKRMALTNGVPARRKTSASGTLEKYKQILEAVLPQFIDSLVSTAADRVNDYLRTLNYLGPLRAYPDRGFSLEDRSDPNWRAGGGHAWEMLRDEGSLRREVNEFLGTEHLQTGYEFRLNRFVKTREAAKRLAQKKARDADEQKLQKLIEDPALPHVNQLALYDLRNEMQVSHRDVGVGLSQVVPVLLLSAASDFKTIIVEQPELHIHPALQADLADIFIKSALLRGNRFILETHSENLMLRLLKRIRQSFQNDPEYPADWPKLSPEMISVVYAKAGKNGTDLIPIQLTQDGDFENRWPDGFFTERARELFS